MRKKDSLPTKSKTNETGEPQKKKFKLTRQQLQGAGALLLVCALIVTLVVTSGKADFLLGTTFEDQEDAVENMMVVEPSTIDAEKDYKGQTFTIIGLPEADLANIKAEHITFGGYLANLKPESLEIADGSLMVQAIKDEAVTEDWAEYEGDSGFVAISQDAFTDQVSYQGEVAVTYPQLTTSVEAIAQAADFSIVQEISFTLENDQFAGDITAADVTVTGGMTNITIDNFRQAGNVCSFTLNGIGDGKFSEAQFAISGEKLAKGIPLKTSIGIGRVPKAEQASALYLNNSAEQKLTVHLEYDTFNPAIDASMLAFIGSMSEFSLTGLRLVDDFTLELTLTGGPGQPGTGSIVFDSAAVESGRTGREALMTIEDQNAPAAPASVQEAPLSAAPSSVAGEIPGLGFMCDVVWDWTSAAIRRTDTTETFLKEIGKRPKETDTANMLTEISGQLTDLSLQIEQSTREITKGFAVLNYDQVLSTISEDLKYVEKCYEIFEQQLALDAENEGHFETWAKENLAYTMKDSVQASKYMQSLTRVVEQLSPEYKAKTTYSSNIFLSYEEMCKDNTPFEHNAYMAMASYLWGWDADIAKYMTYATAIVDYNTTLDTGTEQKMMGDFAKLTNTVEATFTKMDEHVLRTSYNAAYQQLVVPDQPNAVFYVVDSINAEKYLIADSLNNDYHANYVGYTKPYPKTINQGVRTSRGFLALDWFHGEQHESYWAVHPTETYENVNYRVEFADKKKKISAPQKTQNFMNHISETKISLMDVFNTYLINFEDLRNEEAGTVQTVKLLGDVNFKWLYGAATNNYMRSGSLYYNDRTLMIDMEKVPDGKYPSYSVTCEDGLYKNKQEVKSGENILILMSSY